MPERDSRVRQPARRTGRRDEDLLADSDGPPRSHPSSSRPPRPRRSPRSPAPAPPSHRNEILLWVETQLRGEVLPGTDELADILAKFMELAQ